MKIDAPSRPSRFAGTHFKTLLLAALLWLPLSSTRLVQAAEFVVYNVYQGVDLGDGSPSPKKDFFLNMGSSHGLKVGSLVEVSRRTASFHAISEKLVQEVTFPIARLKIIHVEPRIAIARLDKLLPVDQAPSISPRAVMVGDLIKLAY